MGQPVTISTASVPSDFCPTSFAQAWPFGVSLLQAELSGNNFSFNYGPTTPGPDDRDKPWFRTNADGTPDRWYVYVSGAWIAKNPTPVGATWIFTGIEADITTFDGGEAGAVTATTGPMWERDTAFDARFPVGVGTLPSTATIAVTGTGGEEKHKLIEEEIPAHDHNLPIVMSTKVSPKTLHAESGSEVGGVAPEVFGGDSTGATVEHNNLPPYVGVFFIRKTARLYYRL